MRNHLLKSIFISLILVMGISNAWSDNNVKVYCAIKASDLNCYTLKVNANIGDNGTWRQYTMEKLDETYEGRLIYQATIVEKYGGVDALQFQLYEGNDWKSQKQPYSTWTTSSNFANKLYVYDTGKWITKTKDSSYTVYFVNTDSWTGTIKAYAWNSDCDKNKDWSGADMTSTGKTYKGKNIYSITLNKRYANIIFNNGSSKTGDLTLGSTNIGKMYDGSNWVDYNVDPVVTFKANGGTGSDYTQTVKYNTSTALTANTFTRKGYTFAGWNTKTDGTGTSYSDKQEVKLTANTTLYAKWTENTYTVTISAGTGGTVSPSGSQTIGQVTQTTVTATANDNYEFANWTATGGVIVANNSAASTTITATATGTLTANFRSTATNSLTVVAGANIESVSGSTDPITLGNTYEIKATPKTGYTFSTWTANPAENATFGSATTAETTVTVNNGSVTVTASATENMSTLTTSNKYDAGDPGYAVPYATVSKIGIATEAKITATTAGNGYTFTGWTLTNCTRTDGGAADATSITVRSNGDGKAATVVANYAEDCKTAWVLAHSIDGFNTSSHPFVKKSGESTGKVAYVSLDLAANTAYTFKVKNGDKWYGNNNSEEQWWIKQTAEDWSFYSDAGDCHMKSGLAGTYTFKIDYSGADPKVSVYFPEIYAIVGSFNEWNENVNKLTFDGNIGTTTINLEASATNYEFKVIDNAVHGGIVDKTITQTENDLAIIVGGGDNIKLTANANPKGNYIFTYDKSTKKLSVTYPTVYTITVEAENGTVEGAGTYVEGTSVTLTATPAEGYHFVKWSNESTTNPLTITVTEDIELQAIFDINTYTVTTTAENGTVEGTGTFTHGATVTLTATPNFDYEFVKWSNESTENPLTITVTKDVELTAIFAEVQRTTVAESGVFTVGEYQTAIFATGNLQYKKDGENETWRFAKQQYQVVGEQNINVGDPAFKGWIDMFGWSTNDAGNNFGVNPSMATHFYTGDFNDWGIKIGEGWLTLTHNQWDYLLNKRANASSLKQVAYVGTVFGIMLLPDNWTYPDGCKVEKTLNHDDADGSEYDFDSYNYTLDQWAKLEAAGAVFLPAAGRRFGGYGNTYNSNGENTGSTIQVQHSTNGLACYWTSSKHTDNIRVSSLFNLLSIGGDKYKYGILNLGWYGYGNIGQSVRLAKVTSTLIEIGDGDNSAVITPNAGKTVNVQLNRSFTAGVGYYTLCLPFDIAAEKIGTAYQLGEITEHVSGEKGGININLTEVDKIEAGVPYLVLPNTLTNPVFEKVIIENTTGSNYTVTGAGVKVTFTGIINGKGEKTDGETEYYVGDNGYLYNGKVNKLGLRAFFTITDDADKPISGLCARVVAQEDEATGVEDITAPEGQVLKVIENGQLIIIRGGEKYNVQGVRL